MYCCLDGGAGILWSGVVFQPVIESLQKSLRPLESDGAPQPDVFLRKEKYSRIAVHVPFSGIRSSSVAQRNSQVLRHQRCCALHDAHTPTLKNNLTTHGWYKQTVSALSNDPIHLHPKEGTCDFHARETPTNQPPQHCRPERDGIAAFIVGVSSLAMPIMYNTSDLD
jgi:hypothetical protein